MKQLCRHLLYLQLSRSLGRHESLSSEQKIALAEELQVHYKKTKCFNAGLLATDPKPNDGYALLAAHLLLDVWNKDLGILYRCLVLLENALAESPANYHLKLLMTRVYTLAGVFLNVSRNIDCVTHVFSRRLRTGCCSSVRVVGRQVHSARFAGTRIESASDFYGAAPVSCKHFGQYAQVLHHTRQRG